GYAKVARLQFIANHTPALSEWVYLQLLEVLRTETLDTERYRQTHQLLAEPTPLGNHPPSGGDHGSYQTPPPLDEAWIRTTEQSNRTAIDRLEAELGDHRHEMNRAGIYASSWALADQLYRMGKARGALKLYLRTRDFCSSIPESIKLQLRIIDLAVLLQEWGIAGAQMSKLRSITQGSFPVESDEDHFQAVAGIGHLRTRNYLEAAQHFSRMQTDPDQFVSQVISPLDIATYTTMCALATYNRDELKGLIYNSPRFKHYLELDPALPQILEAFYSCQFREGFELLKTQKALLQLDMFMSGLLDSVETILRKAMLHRYIKPLNTISIPTMATAFGVTPAFMESTLFRLITQDNMDAEID
ncbi:26S proteasome subunit RPN7-domain-containing protein, partial [Dimargaris cristalligena]